MHFIWVPQLVSLWRVDMSLKKTENNDLSRRILDILLFTEAVFCVFNAVFHSHNWELPYRPDFKLLNFDVCVQVGIRTPLKISYFGLLSLFCVTTTRWQKINKKINFSRQWNIENFCQQWLVMLVFSNQYDLINMFFICFSVNVYKNSRLRKGSIDVQCSLANSNHRNNTLLWFYQINLSNLSIVNVFATL